jgi:hypothetical protein
MKLHQLFETTTSGAIAPVSAPLGSTQKRAGSLFKGKKTKKPFYEGEVDETRRMSPGEKLSRAFDRERAKSQRVLDAAARERDAIMARWAKEKEEHEKKNAPTQPVAENDADDREHTADVQAAFNNQLKKNNAVPIDEAALAEEDIKENDVVLAPGKGSKFRSDIISKKKSGPLSKFKPPFKATGLWISDSRGARVSECETAEIAAEVAKMLNTPVDEGTVLMKGASPEARQRDIDQSDREYIIQRQQREAAKRYKYTHDVEIEPDGENAKMWHYIEDTQTGKKYEPDWSPYSQMTPDDVRFYMNLTLHGGEPTREEAQSNGPLRSEDLMKIMKNRQSGQKSIEEGPDEYYKPRYDFTGSQKDVPPGLGIFDRKKTISVDGASYGYVPKMGRIWIYQSGSCLGWVEPKKNPVTPNDLRELIRKYLPTIPKDYLKKFNAEGEVNEEIIMDWDKFPDKTTAKGWENLKALTQAADYQTDADIELGDDLVTLDNKEVHLVLSLYKEAVYAKRHEEMLRVLASPHKFHKMIKLLAAGQNPKFTEIVEGPRSPEISRKYGIYFQQVDNDKDFFEEVNSDLQYFIKKHFKDGKAWFNGGAYSYLVDLSKPNLIYASDGSPIKVAGWAQGLKDYASSWAWEELIGSEPEWYWKELFRPVKSLKGQADHEQAARMGYSDTKLREGLLHSDSFLEVTDKGKVIVVSWGGNMGNTEQRSIKPIFDKKYGRGSFDKIRKAGKIYKDKKGNVHNDPSYSWVLLVPKEQFKAMTRPTKSARSVRNQPDQETVAPGYSPDGHLEVFETKWYDNPRITAKYKKIMEQVKAKK